MYHANCVFTSMSGLLSDMEKYSADAASLMQILRRLRAPDGCPWDRKQTRQSLVRHLESECGELIDAIDHNDPPHICEELGDVLMNLFFQVVIAEENSEFTLTDVWQNIVDKMIRRHAHVFGSENAADADDVIKIWERVKAAERRESGKENVSILDSVKHSLSALNRAEKLQEKAAEVNFDWSDTAGIISKIKEEIGEVEQALQSGDDAAVDEELGDLLFSAVNLVRYRKQTHSEELLRRANLKFERRFRALEAIATAKNLKLPELSAAELDELWNQVKLAEK